MRRPPSCPSPPWCAQSLHVCMMHGIHPHAYAHTHTRTHHNTHTHGRRTHAYAYAYAYASTPLFLSIRVTLLRSHTHAILSDAFAQPLNGVADDEWHHGLTFQTADTLGNLCTKVRKRMPCSPTNLLRGLGQACMCSRLCLSIARKVCCFRVALRIVEFG